MSGQKPFRNTAPKKTKRKSANAKNTLGQRISWEAARILAEGCAKNYLNAKTKAVHHLNLPADTRLPSNLEVELALKEHVALFDHEDHETRLRKAREQALEIMLFLEAFGPRLVGPVLKGMLTPGSSIQIHVFADTPEEISFVLDDHRIPYRSSSTHLQFGQNNAQLVHTIQFLAGKHPIELFIFSSSHDIPRGPIDGKSMERATIKKIKYLLNQGVN